jgi:hypothetical protein
MNERSGFRKKAAIVHQKRQTMSMLVLLFARKVFLRQDWNLRNRSGQKYWLERRYTY